MTPTPTPDAASLVERLRKCKAHDPSYHGRVLTDRVHPLCTEAADRIAALEAEKGYETARLNSAVETVGNLEDEIAALEARVREADKELATAEEWVDEIQQGYAAGSRIPAIRGVLRRARALVGGE